MPRSYPYLTVSRPSPTTALYSVSTHPPHPSLPQKLLTHTLHVLRLLVLLANLTILILKWQEPLALPPSSIINSVIPSTTYTYLRTLQTQHLHPTPWHHVLLAALALQALTLLLLPIPQTEHLLTLRGLGIQLSSSTTTSSFPLSLLLTLHQSSAAASTRFIPTSQIRDIFIHEAFRGFEVRYYLGVVVEGGGAERGGGGEDIVVVFPGLLPGREVVEEVWRGARGCLFEEEGAWRRERREKEGIRDSSF